MPRSLLAWGLWFLAFFWVWMLLVGDWNRIEWIGGACVSAVAATIAEPVRRTARVDLGVALEVVRGGTSALLMVFVDFGILVVALARTLVTGRSVRGSYITRSFDPGPKTTPAGAVRRAWTVLIAGYSPNAYVVDIDVEERTVLLHDLVPHRNSEKPA
jgi:hypothetical protein